MLYEVITFPNFPNKRPCRHVSAEYGVGYDHVELSRSQNVCRLLRRGEMHEPESGAGEVVENVARLQHVTVDKQDVACQTCLLAGVFRIYLEVFFQGCKILLLKDFGGAATNC